MARDDTKGIQDQPQLHEPECQDQDGEGEAGDGGPGSYSKRELTGFHAGPDEGPQYDDGYDEQDGRAEGGNGRVAPGTPQEEGRWQLRQHLQPDLQVEDPPMTAESPGMAAILAADSLQKSQEFSETPKTISDSMARFFEQSSQDLGPKAFQELIQKRTVLVEVACSPIAS